MPNSVLWILLVGIWLFVVGPMVISRRSEASHTSDVALATRVLHRGGRVLSGMRSGRSVGKHPHDAQWTAPEIELDEIELDEVTTGGVKTQLTKVDSALIEFDDHLDVNADYDGDEVIDEFSEAANDDAAFFLDAELANETTQEVSPVIDEQDELAELTQTMEEVARPSRSGSNRRSGFNIAADNQRSAAKYAVRQRITLGLLALVVIAAVSGIFVGAPGFIAAGIFGFAFVGYLMYLRSTVRMEKQIRERRRARSYDYQRSVAQRQEAGRPLFDSSEMSRATQRAQRMGAIVLEIDDEDPSFDHLPHYDWEEHEYGDYRYPATNYGHQAATSYRRVAGE